MIPRGPAVVLGITSTVTIGAIAYSHYSQVRDKLAMKAGVERDKERMKIRRKLAKGMGGVGPSNTEDVNR